MNTYHVIFDSKLAVVQAPDELTARTLGLKMLQREGKTRCSRGREYMATVILQKKAA